MGFEKVQHDRSSDSHEGHASEGTQQRPRTSGSVSCEGPGDQDGADQAREQDQGA